MPDSPAEKPPGISSRKAEHIALCETDEVAFKQVTTLLEQVQLVHDALPELAISEVDLSTDFAGKRLRAPVIIAAMTGGTDQAEAINRDLAALAERFGLGFGFGSQRPLLSGITKGYDVRDVAPTALILGNIGVVQARQTSTAALRELVARCGADALVVHLNPAMELVQPGGDQDFRGGLETIRRLVGELDVPLVVKETGCGLSREVGERLVAAGVKWVDTSGAGGTSWVGVEALRATGEGRRLGELFWDWGIPTAASVAQLDGLGLGVCATGGVASGVDIARAIALGARCGGIARPLLQARARGGVDELNAKIAGILDELRVIHLLTGSRTPEVLRTKSVVLGAQLARWMPRGGPLSRRAMTPHSP